MTQSPCADQLAEVQQIEAIMQRGHKQFLSCETLYHISYANESLPLYALSLGNRDADIPSITFVGGDSWSRGDWYSGGSSFSGTATLGSGFYRYVTTSAYKCSATYCTGLHWCVTESLTVRLFLNA